MNENVKPRVGENRDARQTDVKSHRKMEIHPSRKRGLQESNPAPGFLI